MILHLSLYLYNCASNFRKLTLFIKKRRTFVIFLLFLCVHTVVIVLPTFPPTFFFRQKTNISVIFFLQGNFPIGQQHSCEKRSLYVLLIDVNLAEMLKISLFFPVYTFYVKRQLSLSHQMAIEFES